MTDLSDPVFDGMEMPIMEERRVFLEVCFESYEITKHTRFEADPSDWKVFIYVLLQMKLVDLNKSDDFITELKDKMDKNGHSQCGWCYKTDEHNRIKKMQLEPRNNQSEIPGIIRRLDHLEGLYITGRNVDSLPLEAISMLPRLQELKISLNAQSLTAIADQIRSEQPCIVSKSLRSVHFLQDNVWEERQFEEYLERPDTKAALRTILDFFVTIDTIKLPYDNIGQTNVDEDDWKYALVKNLVGRRFLEGVRFGGDGNGNNNSLSLALWPIILEKAQDKTEENEIATGIYYLLQNGPVLIGRRDIESNPDRPSLLRAGNPDRLPVLLARLTRASIDAVEKYLAHECNGRRLPKIYATAPFANNSNNEPEHDFTSTPELGPAQRSYYQSQTDVLRRMVELGRRDISSEVEQLENHVVSPRQEHMEAVFRIYSYLKLEQVSKRATLLSDSSSSFSEIEVYPPTENLCRYVDDNRSLINRWNE